VRDGESTKPYRKAITYRDWSKRKEERIRRRASEMRRGELRKFFKKNEQTRRAKGRRTERPSAQTQQGLKRGEKLRVRGSS